MKEFSFSKAVLVYMTLVLIGFALFGGSKPRYEQPKRQELTYRWCKVGEDPKINDCVDGSGSGG